MTETPAPGLQRPVAAHRRRRPPLLVVLAVVAAIALSAVWAGGGFAARRDQVTRVDPGTAVTVGPYELSFTGATVQYDPDDQVYEVLVHGRGRTTADLPMAPSISQSFTRTQDLGDSAVHRATIYRYGDGTDLLVSPDFFTPGLAPITFVTGYEFTATPGPQIRLLVYDLEFSDNSILQDQDPTWNLANRGYDMILPVETLPDRTY